MGCDIHTIVEVRNSETGKWEAVELDPPVFDWRSYGLFGFLADVRNYSCAPSIAPGRGWPADASISLPDEDTMICSCLHGFTSVTLAELLAYNYDGNFEDRRVSKGGNGAVTAEPGGGTRMTFREFLGEGFFNDIDRLQVLGVTGRAMLHGELPMPERKQRRFDLESAEEPAPAVHTARDDVRVLMYFDN